MKINMRVRNYIIISALMITFGLSARSNPLKSSRAIKGAMVLQQAMREIYREVNPAVVRIETEDTVQSNPFFNNPQFRFFFDIPRGNRSRKQQGLGSGFIISKDGFIVTNHHVVAKRDGRSNKYVDKIKVKLINGNTYEAKVIGSDQKSDIALLKIQTRESIRVVHIGDSDKIAVGDFAIAIGNPFGLSSTFTMGVISSKGQEISAADGVPRIQTDTPINPGNSGGPLLSIQGEVVGINQMIYSKSGGSNGIGFAIPINYAMEIVKKLKRGEAIKYGYIGVLIESEPEKNTLRELKVSRAKGLLVKQVQIGSPAWKAGIRPYDYITHIDGKSANKFSVLKSAVIRKGVGNSLRVRLLRNGKRRSFSIKIGAAKS